MRPVQQAERVANEMDLRGCPELAAWARAQCPAPVLYAQSKRSVASATTGDCSENLPSAKRLATCDRWLAFHPNRSR